MSIGIPSGNFTKSYWKWPFIVDFPIKHGDFPVRYVSLPEGTLSLGTCSQGSSWTICAPPRGARRRQNVLISLWAKFRKSAVDYSLNHHRFTWGKLWSSIGIEQSPIFKRTLLPAEDRCLKVVAPPPVLSKCVASWTWSPCNGGGHTTQNRC